MAKGLIMQITDNSLPTRLCPTCPLGSGTVSGSLCEACGGSGRVFQAGDKTFPTTPEGEVAYKGYVSNK